MDFPVYAKIVIVEIQNILAKQMKLSNQIVDKSDSMADL